MPTEENSEASVRAVLDTNALISAALTPRGIAGRIIHHAQDNDFELVTSDPLLAELRGVIHRTKISGQIGVEQCESFVKLIEETAEMVSSHQKLQAVKADISDNRVLEAALAGKADYIVTGDKKHLLSLKEFRGIKIASPRDFLNDLLKFWLD